MGFGDGRPGFRHMVLEQAFEAEERHFEDVVAND